MTLVTSYKLHWNKSDQEDAAEVLDFYIHVHKVVVVCHAWAAHGHCALGCAVEMQTLHLPVENKQHPALFQRNHQQTRGKNWVTIMLKYSKQETYIEFAEFSTEFHRSESVLIKTIIPHDPFQHFEVATTQPVTTLVNHLYTDHQLSTSILAHLSTVSITAQQHNKSVIKTNTERRVQAS